MQNNNAGWDWLWLALAAFSDVASTASAAYTNRNRIPAGMPGASTPTAGGTSAS